MNRNDYNEFNNDNDNSKSNTLNFSATFKTIKNNEFLLKTDTNKDKNDKNERIPKNNEF